MIYFAYGSNLDEQQMRQRCPGAVPAGTAGLRDHRLVFVGHSSGWDGAVASVVPEPGRVVPGLLYELGDEDGESLDGHEGCPRSYQRRNVTVVAAGGEPTEAFLYVKPDDPCVAGTPSPEYLAVLQDAYRRLGLEWKA